MNILNKLANGNSKDIEILKGQFVPPPKRKNQLEFNKLYWRFCDHTIPLFDNYFVSPTGEIVTAAEVTEDSSRSAMIRLNFPLPSDESHIDWMEQYYDKRENKTLTEQDVLKIWIHLEELTESHIEQLEAKGMPISDLMKIKKLF